MSLLRPGILFTDGKILEAGHCHEDRKISTGHTAGGYTLT